MKKYILASLGLMAAFSASADSVDFGYAGSGLGEVEWGTGKAETFGIAIKVDNAALNGMKVTSIQVPLVDGAAYSDCYVFLAKELKGSNGKPQSEVKVDFEPGSGSVSVKLPDAYTIDGAFYAGYAFKIAKATSEADKYPVSVVEGYKEGGMYVTSSRTYKKWSTGESADVSSALSVTIDGEFMANHASVVKFGDLLTTPGVGGSASVVIVNGGSAPISSLAYSYEIDGKTSEGTATFSPAIPADLTSRGSFDVEIPAIEATGTYEGVLSISKINDADVKVSGQNAVYVMERMPVHRVVMEEFTGTWCGWCPRGWQAIEILNAEMPDKFIALAYHDDDIMQTMSQFPVPVDGYPLAYLDRDFDVDPYFGTSSSTPMGVRDDVAKKAAEMVDANIEVSAEYSADGNQINVTGSVYYFRDFAENPYLLSFAVTEDGLTGDSEDWYQANKYAGASIEEYGEEMAFWINGEGSMKVDFNDVVLASAPFRGVAGSQPESVKAGETYDGSYSFDCSKFVSTEDFDSVSLLQNRDKVNVVALLVNKSTGHIVNGAKFSFDKGSVGNIADDLAPAAKVSTQFFDLAGRRLSSAPENGIYIQIDSMSDGSRKASKRIR